MGLEKRRHTRFRVREDAMVAIQNGFNKIGKVQDIGLGGLSFEHINEGDLEWVNARKNIILLVNDSRLSKIPCRIVYDSPLPIPPEYGSLTIRLITSRCGVQFEPLTDDQADQLEFFLKTYTKDEA